MTDVQAVYDALSREVFAGTLPRCVVRAVPGPIVSVEGKPLRAWCNRERRRISVRADLRGRALRETLVHEAAHLAADGHGGAFRSELRRLGALAPAPWVGRFVEAEIAECERRFGEKEQTMQRKTFVTTAVTKAAGRTRTFIITSGAVDRDNDVISPDGWDFTHWKANPVILPSHDYGAWPIARGSNLRRIGDAWAADFTFAESPEGDAALQLVDAGMLNACSVGFRPLESSYDGERRGTNFIRQELLEVSVCPVPANPDALVQRAAALGLRTEMVRKMFGGGGDLVLQLADEPDDDVELDMSGLLSPECIASIVAKYPRGRRRTEPFGDPRATRGQEVLTFDEADFAAAMRTVIREALASLPDVVREQVEIGLRKSRGRVD